MQYVVFVKQVPDTDLIRIDEKGNLLREGVPSVLDPYSEHALELALKIKTKSDAIIVVTMGPAQAGSALRRCLEIGADKVYLLTDRAFAGADVYATSRTLSAFVKNSCRTSTFCCSVRKAWTEVRVRPPSRSPRCCAASSSVT